MSSGDQRMVRQAARRLGVQAAALVAVAMLLLVGVVTLVVVHGQRAAGDDLLRTAASTVDDVDDPPAGAWIVLSGTAGTQATAGLPDELTGRLEQLRTPTPLRAQLRTVSDDDGSFRVLTRPASSKGTVQVVLDLRTQHDQRDRLLQAMAVAAACSLLLAGAIGALLGRRAVRPLAHALSLQRRFVADASHELRTPLTVLSTRAQLLDRGLRGSGAAPQLQEDARGLAQDALRLGDVVEDLLLAADPRPDAAAAPVELREVARQVLDSVQAHAGASQVRVELETGSERGAVLGTEPALRRALLALVDNAIEHTPVGGMVCVSVRRRGADVVLRVSDTGPGLPPGQAEHVLQRFRSGGQRAGRAHYGLGLALAHDVADRHGGRLGVAPSDVGAAFELSLPAASA